MFTIFSIEYLHIYFVIVKVKIIVILLQPHLFYETSKSNSVPSMAFFLEVTDIVLLEPSFCCFTFSILQHAHTHAYIYLDDEAFKCSANHICLTRTDFQEQAGHTSRSSFSYMYSIGNQRQYEQRVSQKHHVHIHALFAGPSSQNETSRMIPRGDSWN